MYEHEITEGDIVVIDYITHYTKERRNEGKVIVLWKGIGSQPLVTKIGEYRPYWSSYYQISEKVGHIDLEELLRGKAE